MSKCPVNDMNDLYKLEVMLHELNFDLKGFLLRIDRGVLFSSSMMETSADMNKVPRSVNQTPTVNGWLHENRLNFDRFALSSAVPMRMIEAS
mmetsp:Transcript_11324/g.13134  ORF Transcript_11324/g.13134 Transcript_11324/m.13134 type:complete len:92 (-) Transcript_11324:392-667(-)